MQSGNAVECEQEPDHGHAQHDGQRWEYGSWSLRWWRYQHDVTQDMIPQTTPVMNIFCFTSSKQHDFGGEKCSGLLL